MRYVIKYIITTWSLCTVFCQVPPVVNGVPPKVHGFTILEPKPIQNVRGLDNLVLVCSASGNPAPTIEWSFNGVKFVKDQPLSGKKGDVVRHELSGNRITIRNVSGQYYDESNKHDTGRYRCIARNDVGAVFLEKYIKIRVMAKFNFQNSYPGQPTLLRPIIGESYMIPCPPHRLGYGCVYRWGNVRKYRGVDFFRSGDPNERMFITANGSLVYSYVTIDDIMQSSQLGGFSCVIINYRQYVASNAHQFVGASETRDINHSPNMLTHMPKSMHAPVDTDYVMVCGATGRPLPVYRWEYQGVPIENMPGSNKLNFEFFEFPNAQKMELRISRLTKYSGGTFRCFASNSIAEVYKTGELVVLFPPKWKQVFPESVEVIFGSHYVLVCNASGFPKPKFEWFQNGARLYSSLNHSKTVTGTGPNDNEGILTIKKTSLMDTGMYTCVSYNEVDTLTMSIFVKVIQMIPKFPNTLNDSIYLFEDENALIDCNPLGPISTKEWLKNGINIRNEGRFSKLDNGSLHILNVQASDAGNYRCTAKNDFGTSHSYKTIIVLNGLKIPRHSGNRAVLVSSKVNLFCDVQSDEVVQPTIRWYKNENAQILSWAGNLRLEKRVNGPPYLLTIQSFSDEFIGNYICEATVKMNDHESKKSVSMKVNKTFANYQALSDINPTAANFEVHGNALLLTWKATYKEYNVEWYEEKNNAEKKNVVLQTTQHILKDLKSFTYYTIAIYGIQKSSKMLIHKQNNVAVSLIDIPANTEAPVVNAIGYNSLSVMFTLSTYGGVPDRVFVHYKPKGNKTAHLKTVSQAYKFNTSILLTGLDFVLYDIWTIAANSIGESEASSIVIYQPIRKPVVKERNINIKKDGYDTQKILLVLLYILLGCAILACILWLVSCFVHKKIRKNYLLIFGSEERVSLPDHMITEDEEDKEDNKTLHKEKEENPAALMQDMTLQSEDTKI